MKMSFKKDEPVSNPLVVFDDVTAFELLWMLEQLNITIRELTKHLKISEPYFKKIVDEESANIPFYIVRGLSEICGRDTFIYMRKRYYEFIKRERRERKKWEAAR